MKKYISRIALGCCLSLALSSCMDNFDEPATDGYLVTSPVSVGETNTTIGEVKTRYCASSAGADYARNASNFYTKVTEDLVIEGVVAANDVSGNLYQTLLIRNIDDEAGTDQSILLTIKSTALYIYFPLGQRVRVNLKDLYLGCYSKTPKIGEPYVSSYGNLNLGAMNFDRVSTHIELLGEPDPNAPELVPVEPEDSWLRATANQNYMNSPMLGTVTGNIVEADASHRDVAETGEVTGDTEPLPKTFGPYELHDNGFGVDRNIQLQSNTSKVAIRTSTKNEVAHRLLPSGVCSFTGILTYYSGWQIQLRDLNDLEELGY